MYGCPVCFGVYDDKELDALKERAASLEKQVEHLVYNAQNPPNPDERIQTLGALLAEVEANYMDKIKRIDKLEKKLEKYESEFEKKKRLFAADAVIIHDDKILLIKRSEKSSAHPGKWALPGGFVEPGESAERACSREVEEEVIPSENSKIELIQQIKTYSDPKRDPRGPVVTTAFLAKYNPSPNTDGQFAGGDDADAAKWFSLDEIPKLGFDHNVIVNDALKLLKQGKGV